MKYATINERYSVLYSFAGEFPQFKNSRWILVDNSRRGEQIDLFLITEETFIDECYPDITRAQIEAAVKANNGTLQEMPGWYFEHFKNLHKLGCFYKINSGYYKWTLSLYMKSPFGKTFAEIGNVEIAPACDVYDAYLHTRKTFPDFEYITEIISIDDWRCDIVQKGAAE